MDDRDLNELDAIFKDMGGVDKIEDYTTQYTNLPDGTYVGEIEKVYTGNSKKDGNPYAAITIAFENGKKETKFLSLAGANLDQTKSNIARSLTQLRKLGIEGEAVSDFINNAITQLVGVKVIYKVETVTYIKNGEEKEYRNQDIELY